MNLKTLLFGRPSRLRHVVRFSHCRRLSPESVAEHSYYVVLYSLVVAKWAMKHSVPAIHGSENAFLARVLAQATLHDLEEASSGDFPRDFKYSSPALTSALSLASVEAFEKVLDDLDPADRDPVGRAVYRTLWREAKSTASPEGCVVAFADFLAAFYWIQSEVSSGNRGLLDQVSSVFAYLETFYAPEYSFLRPLVDEATELVGDLK